MSYPHRPAVPGGSPPAARKLTAVWQPKQSQTARPAGTATEHRPLRAMPLARRYEADFLEENGDIGSLSRLAPAMPLFEQAFSGVARGTLIATENGPVAVEDLLPGDRLTTAEGETRTLLWSGRITLYPAQSGEEPRGALAPEPARLTRIMAESFGFARPLADVVLGPHARVLRRDRRFTALVGQDQAYVPIRALQDGENVIEVAPATPVTVHHLVLDRQCTLSAGGIQIESFHPGATLGEMMDPQLLALFLTLFPHLPQYGGGLAGFGAEAFPRLTRFEAEDLLAA